MFWLTWELSTKYLSASFHHKKTASYLQELVRLEWENIGAEKAELVVLAIGLALHDIYAVHFQEEDQLLLADMPI